MNFVGPGGSCGNGAKTQPSINHIFVTVCCQSCSRDVEELSTLHHPMITTIIFPVNVYKSEYTVKTPLMKKCSLHYFEIRSQGV